VRARMRERVRVRLCARMCVDANYKTGGTSSVSSRVLCSRSSLVNRMPRDIVASVNAHVSASLYNLPPARARARCIGGAHVGELTSKVISYSYGTLS